MRIPERITQALLALLTGIILYQISVMRDIDQRVARMEGTVQVLVKSKP